MPRGAPRSLPQLCHRYRRARRYRITVVATDTAGNRTTRHLWARVLARRRAA